MKTVRDFLKDSLIYSAGSWISKSLGIILVPIYTRVFSPGDYGILDLVATTVALVTIFITLGLDSALGRHFNEAKNPKDQGALFSTILSFQVVLSLPLVGLIIYFADPLAGILGNIENLSSLISWAAVSILTATMWNSWLLLLRLRFESVFFSMLSILHLSINVGLTLYFVLVKDSGLVGIYWAAVGTDVLVIVFLMIRNFSFLKIPDWTRLPGLLAFGVPLLPSAIAYFSMQHIDRYFLIHYSGLATVGLYAIAYKVSNLLLLLAAGFGRAWPPFLYKIYKEPGGNSLIESAFRVYSYTLLSLSVILGIFGHEILKILTTPDYVEAYALIPIISLSVVIFFATGSFSVGILLTKKTMYKFWAGLGCAGFNILLNYLLIPKYGALGAASATLLSYVVYGIVLMTISQKLYPLKLGFGSFLILVFLSLALITAVLDGQFSLTIKTGTAVMLLALPWAIRFIKIADFIGTGRRARP